MNAIMKAIAKGAVAILWNKKTLKWLVRYGNEELAKRVSLDETKKMYAGILTDALAERIERMTWRCGRLPAAQETVSEEKPAE